MTDAEKELRRLAEEARHGGFISPPHLEFTAKVTPSAVLALLDRIDALEKQVGEAERKGAEEMKRRCYDAACDVCSEAIDKHDLRAASGAGETSRRIDRLPLPGDAP